MKNIGAMSSGLAAVILLLLLPSNATSESINFRSFGCISNSSCVGGSLEGFSTSALPAGNIVSVGGYYETPTVVSADGGGGEFVVLGQLPNVCNVYNSSSGNMTGNVGLTTINFTVSPYPTGLTVGELVSGSGTGIEIVPGSEVASISMTGSPLQITAISLTLPLVGTASPTSPTTLSSFSITSNNTGTLITDSYSSGTIGANCYQKTNYRGDPHEFGAYGDSNYKGTSGTDDTTAIQNWLGAYGNVNPNLAPANAPANFGPWIASIPANYKINTPLFCPPNATILGTENLQNVGTPRTNFVAGSHFAGFSYPVVTGDVSQLPTTGFFGLQGVFAGSAFCRLSSVAVSGNGFVLSTTGNTHASTTIDSLGSTVGVRVGNAVVGADVIAGTLVTNVNSNCSSACSITVSQATSGSGSSGEAITFLGPDGVDVIGDHVTIDGYSLLTAGHYDLFCGIPGALFGDVAIKDSYVESALSDDIEIPGPCSNARFIGDIVANAGTSFSTSNGITGDGILFSATEADIEGGVIEGSAGVGLHLRGAQRVSVTGMHIQGNGVGQISGNGLLGGAGIEIDGSHTISICGNHLEGNGGEDPNSAHIYFQGSPHNINLCGNVYEAQSLADAALRPLFDYDADPSTLITNLQIYDSPAPQASGQVYSSRAALLLPQLQVPHAPLLQVNGLTLSNGATTTKVGIGPGEATDSTGSVTIMEPSGCSVDFTNPAGRGGLDVSGGAAVNTTYFYFVIASASGGNSSCIASRSTVPSLVNANYPVNVSGETQASRSILYNLSSIDGLAVGQTIANNSYMPNGTTIAAVGTLTTQAVANITVSSGIYTVTLTGGATTANMGAGMAISDRFSFEGCSVTGSAQNVLAPANGQGFIISQILTISTFKITGPTSLSMNYSNDCITVSSGDAVTLSNPATTTTSSSTNFTSLGGVYRMIGALYTTATASPITVVPFTQDGNTFYLDQSVTDIETGTPTMICTFSVGTSAVACPLSVPCGRQVATCAVPGLKVLAFGRVVGGTGYDILLSSYDQMNIQTPSIFPGPPGFSTNNSSTVTAFPFRLHTDGNGNVRVQADGPSNTVYEVTDGWVFDRSLQ